MTPRDIIDKSEKIAVISHIKPDGDNLGSLTAMSESLRLYGKDVDSIIIDSIPSNLKFLYGLDNYTSDINSNYDLLIMLDSSDENRLGSAKILIENSTKVFNIDHHISNEMNYDYNKVEPTRSSTGEILYVFLKENNLPIDKNVAESIFTAITSDSGSFRYDTVSSNTFKIAAELLEYDIDRDKINRNLFSSNSVAKVKLLETALERLEFYKDGKIGLTYLLEDDFTKFNAEDSDSDGIVEFIRDIDSVEISIYLRQVKNEFKGSFRSVEYNVEPIARKLGGGGHKRAAGFSIKSNDIDEVIKIVLNEI